MDGISGFKRIFIFLTAQTVFLVACSANAGFMAARHWSLPDLRISLFPAFILAAVGLLMLRAAEPIGASGVELFWGTSVKFHVERFMQPSLNAGLSCWLISCTPT